MTAPRHVAIVGASVAGLTAAESLRKREGFDGRITLIGDEPHLPYDRPPLSKQVLSGKWEPERAALRRAADIEALQLDLLMGHKAVALRPSQRTVELAAGAAVDCDAVVIATGIVPRQLPFLRDVAGVHLLRTLDDCLALRADLLAAQRVIVVGAGFLGTETAATARGFGCDVVLVDIVSEPLTLQLGPEMGRLVAELHRANGVDLRTGVGVDRPIVQDGRIRGLVLADGAEVAADVVVVAVGSTPATGWLQGAGLDLSNGVICDPNCQAAPSVYAAGDVACWPHRHVGGLVRVEQRTNAAEQAQAVAHNLLAGEGQQQPYAPINFAWTDQYDVKIQMYGHRGPDSTFCLLEGSPEENKFVGAYRAAGRIEAVLAWNSPRALLRYRELAFTADTLADDEVVPLPAGLVLPESATG